METENDDIKTCQLLNAAAEENLETLNSLHEQNVDMNQRDYDGRTALHLAVCEQKIKAVKFLINKAKVDMTIPDKYNRLPIDEDTSAQIKDLLERYKNDEKTRNEFSMSATEDTLMHVMKASTLGILNKQTDLRYKYFKMDSCDYFGDTPLHLAAANGNIEDVKYLLFKQRASPFVQNNSRKTPIDLVKENLEFWKLKNSGIHTGRIKEQLIEIHDLIKNEMSDAEKMNIEEDNTFKKLSPKEKLFLFHNRIFKGDIFAIRRFIKTDRDILNHIDYDSRSALHIAAAAGHTHLVKFLLNEGVNKDKQDRYNLTPLDEANRNGDDEMRKLLTEMHID